MIIEDEKKNCKIRKKVKIQKFRNRNETKGKYLVIDKMEAYSYAGDNLRIFTEEKATNYDLKWK